MVVFPSRDYVVSRTGVVATGTNRCRTLRENTPLLPNGKGFSKAYPASVTVARGRHVVVKQSRVMAMFQGSSARLCLQRCAQGVLGYRSLSMFQNFSDFSSKSSIANRNPHSASLSFRYDPDHPV
jgi:hypothetical protein